MATIDSLEIEISSKIKRTITDVDDLSKRLDRLTASLHGVNSRGIATLGAGVNKLANAMSNFSKNVKAEDFNSVANNLKKIGSVKIDTSSVSNASEAIKKVAGAMDGIKDMNFENNAKQLSSVMRSLSGLRRIDDKSIKNATKAIGKLSGAMLSIKNMDFGENFSKVAELAKGLSSLGGKAARNAVTNLPKLASSLNDFMKVMSKAPKIKQNTIDMTNSLSKFAKTGASGGRAAESLGKSLKVLNAVNLKNIKGLNLGKMAASIKSTNIGIKGLISSAGKLFVAFKALQGIFSSAKKAMDISSDLTEVQNVVDVTFGDFKGKIEDLSKTSITDYGMSELTAKQMAGRFQAMGTAIGFSQGKMSDMSVELTKLAGDMASFYNVEQDAVATSLQSVFTGETEPLRRYGLDLTQATLESWAFKQGIDADMQSMSQMEKVMLRYQYVLANTGAAQGDFLRTQDSWANQTRILKQNLEALAGVIGGTLINALKPFVKAMNVALGYVIAFAKTVSNALGKIFGWTYEESGGGLTSDFEGAADGAEDIADSTGTAANNIKKMQAGLRAFDELKVINMPEADLGDASGGGAGSGIGGGTAAGADGKWKETDSIIKKFESEIDSLYKLGEYIGNSLSKAMESIPWDKVYEKARNFGKGLADFLNGLISPRLFGNLGKTVAGGINAALHFLDSFGEKFDFTNFGNSLKVGLVKFLNGIQWKTALSAASNWGIGIAKALNAFISPSTFGDVGKTIANAINTAVQFVLDLGMEFDFKNLGKSIGTGLNYFIKNIKWEQVLKASKTWGKGIADALNNFISTTDFNEVGKSIANSINTVVLGLGTFIRGFKWKKAAEAIADTISSAFKNLNWSDFGRTLADALNAATGTIVTFVKKVKWSEVAKAILNALGGFLKELDYADLAQVVLLLLSAKIAKNAVVGIFSGAAKTIASNLGKSILSQSYFEEIGSKIAKKIIKGFEANISNLKTMSFGQLLTSTSFSFQPIEMLLHFSSSSKKYEEGMAELESILLNLEARIENINKSMQIGFDIGIQFFNTLERMSLIKESVLTGADIGNIVTYYGKIGETTKELIFSLEKVEENFDITKGKIEAMGSIAEEYYTLSSNYSNLTEEQKLQLESYSTILSENIEGFAQFVDAGTGAFNGTKEELDNLVRKTQEYYIVLGAKQALSEYGEELFKLKTKSNSLAKELNEKLSSALDSNGKSYLEWAAEIKGGTDKELAGLLTALENVDYDYGRLDESTKKIYDNQEKTNKTFAEFTDKTKDTAAELSTVRNATDEVNGKMQEGIEIIKDNGEGHIENAVVIAKSQSSVRDEMVQTASISSEQSKKAREDITYNYSFAAQRSKEKIENFRKNALTDLEKTGEAGAIAGLNLLTGFKSNTSDLVPYSKRTMEGVKTTTVSKSSEAGSEGGIIFNNSFATAMDGLSSIGENAINNLNSSLELSSLNAGVLAGVNIGTNIANNISSALYNNKNSILNMLSKIMSNADFDMRIRTGAGGSALGISIIPQYAIGGFPEDGLFMANHGELVGKFANGKTAVANNVQITEGISSAVQAGNRENNALMRQEISLLRTQNEILTGILHKEFGITKNDIGKAARDYSREYFNRTGKPAYIY